jgi:hypothetical protein
MMIGMKGVFWNEPSKLGASIALRPGIHYEVKICGDSASCGEDHFLSFGLDFIISPMEADRPVAAGFSVLLVVWSFTLTNIVQKDFSRVKV